MKITDKYIIEYFKQIDGQINGAKLRKEKQNKNSEILLYLEHRYNPEPFMGYVYVIQCIFKGLTELPKCPVCKNILKNTKNIHCSTKCSSLDPKVREKNEKTCLDLYGDSHYHNIEQMKATNLKNLGVEFAGQSDKVKEKIKNTRETNKKNDPDYINKITQKTKETKLERHGDENYCNKEKIKQTSLKNFGVENPFQAEECKEKAKQTKLEKYNDENYNNPIKAKRTKIERYDDKNYNNRPKMIETYNLKTKEEKQEIINKQKETNLKQFGFITYTATDEYRERARNTCLDKYGVEYFAQSNEYHHKKKKNYTYDSLKFDSSDELVFYIYCKEHNKNIESEPVELEYYFNNKKHVYIPDFRVNNELVEIKGGQFIGENGIWKNPFNAELNDIAKAKYECALKNNVKVISDCSKYKEYVVDKYGKKFIKSCLTKKEE